MLSFKSVWENSTRIKSKIQKKTISKARSTQIQGSYRDYRILWLQGQICTFGGNINREWRSGEMHWSESLYLRRFPDAYFLVGQLPGRYISTRAFAGTNATGNFMFPLQLLDKHRDKDRSGLSIGTPPREFGYVRLKRPALPLIPDWKATPRAASRRGHLRNDFAISSCSSDLFMYGNYVITPRVHALSWTHLYNGCSMSVFANAPRLVQPRSLGTHPFHLYHPLASASTLSVWLRKPANEPGDSVRPFGTVHRLATPFSPVHPYGSVPSLSRWIVFHNTVNGIVGGSWRGFREGF